jgi:hypothetical protein
MKVLLARFEIQPVETNISQNFDVFWDTAPCSPYVNRRIGEMYHLHIQGQKSVD